MGSYTLLFVDDETSILSSLSRAFRKEGYDILKSDNPAEALNILKDKKVHLILSDYRMPEMDGVAFMHEAMKIQPDAIRIILSGYAESSVIISAINNGGIFKFLTKPWDDDLLKVEVRHALERSELENTNTRLIEDVKRRNDILKNVNQLLSEKMDEIQESIISTIEMLIYLSKTKGSELPGNIENATSIGMEVGKRLGLDENDIRNLNIAIRLHDIGNVGIDSCILNKAGALTAEERKEVQKHPSIGGKVLSFLKGYEFISEIVKSHHENYDGTGYPDGLKGKDIPLLSRIVHLVDAYDSLTSYRPYRPPLQPDEIVKILINERGKKFDPEIIDVFLEMLGEKK